MRFPEHRTYRLSYIAWAWFSHATLRRMPKRDWQWNMDWPRLAEYEVER